MKTFIRIFILCLSIYCAPSAFSQDNNELKEVADSLITKSQENANNGNINEAIRLSNEALNIQERVLGMDHPDYATSLHNLAVYNYQMDNYDEAIRLETEALNIRERVLGKDHPDYATSLDYLAGFNSALLNFDKAIRLETEALNIFERVLGKEHPDYASSLNNLAYYNFCLGNYDEAVRLGNEILNITERVYGKSHPNYAGSSSILAVYNSSCGNYDEAIRLETEALNIRERVFGKDHPDYAASLSNLANYNSSLDNYDEAIRLGNEALNIYERTIGKNHPNYATALSNLAHYNFSLGNYDEAIRLSTEALNIRERVLGKGHPDYANSLDNLAGYNSELGNYTEAIRLGTEALNIRECVLGKEHPNYANSLHNLASFNFYLGNYIEAIRLETEALNIFERVLGKDNPNYATALSNLAHYNFSLGNYDEAVRLGTEALNIFERVLGKDNPNYANSLHLFAVYNYQMGNYAEAIRLETEALNIRERVLGKDHPDYARSLNNLAIYNSDLGNYDEAIRLVTEALNITERVLGKDHPDYASSLSNLALYNASLGNYDEAIRLGNEALNIKERVYGKDHRDYAGSLNQLSLYNCDLGNYTEAIRLGNEALNIFERVLGKSHPDYATSLNNLASYNYYLGNYDEAIRLETEALNIAERVLGKDHPNVILYKTNLAKYCFQNNDLKDVERHLVDIDIAYKNYIRTTFANLTSSERTQFWNTEKYWFETSVNKYAYYINSQPIISDGYDMALFAKGILLNSERDFSDLIMKSGDKVALEMFGELRTTRSMLNKLYEKPIAERFMDTDSLENVALQLERRLVEQSKIYGDFTHNMTIGWKDVQQKLGAKDVAIEFVNFSAENDSVMYAAYVLDSKMKNPEFVALFEERQLSNIPVSDYYTTADLSRLIWSNLDKYLKRANNIYFAPAGELYNIAIESLPAYNTEGLISDKQNFYRLSSTRQLAVIKDRNNLDKATLYGGLKYNTNIDILEKDAEKYPNVRNRDFAIFSDTDSLGLRGGANDLPNTKIEVENIGRLLNNKSIKPDIYTDTLGTEASFKDLSGKEINIMHIATHGFYWTQKEVRRLSDNLSFLQIGDKGNARNVEDKALTRSGLLFSGANNALTAKSIPADIQDGVLTAKEIASLDLHGLDILVLSACQTGLGEITGEGVFGLQRGFKKAGANTILMSLWKVDDKATQMLMTKFYELFLSGNHSKSESLALAQKYLREYEEVEIYNDSNMTASQIRKSQRLGEDVENNTVESVITKPFANPIYWAAFILLDAID